MTIKIQPNAKQERQVMRMRVKSSETNAYLRQKIKQGKADLGKQVRIDIQHPSHTIGNTILGLLDDKADIIIRRAKFGKHHKITPNTVDVIIDTQNEATSVTNHHTMRYIKKTLKYIIRHRHAYVMLTLCTNNTYKYYFYPRHGLIKTGYTIRMNHINNYNIESENN